MTLAVILSSGVGDMKMISRIGSPRRRRRRWRWRWRMVKKRQLLGGAKKRR
jgi:hypothetical protein